MTGSAAQALPETRATRERTTPRAGMECKDLTRYFRLLRYLRPYSLQALLSVILMAAVGLLEAFSTATDQTIFDLRSRSPCP